ncbi:MULTISPECIES: DUF4229 domain-containing protein [unclassified Actinotalea]|uniref:DUF4229 domain-containing protein n=1 Tax=unclassified Actinotalea TaxID=2638618 RepID=UPI001CB730E4|nr:MULTISPECIES: DUF4229 domain-containing protein [unclassified Actinotalea]
MLVYSLLRLGLLAGVLVAGWAVGLGGWLLVVVAALVAWALSYLLLAGPRDRAARWIADRAERRRTGPRFSAGVEDDVLAEDAEARGPGAGSPAPGADRPHDPQGPDRQIDSPRPSSTP